MEISFNFCVLTNNNSNLYMVDIYKNDKNERYIKLGNGQFFLTALKVAHLRDYICCIKNVDDVGKNKMRLWKVNVNEERIKDENISTDDEIIQKLSGEEMKIQASFSTYFMEELAGRSEITTENMHIITIIPAGSQKRLKMSRIFCSSNRVDPKLNFYINPKVLVENLGKGIVAGQFCLFHGHRQSGKTTAAWELKRWIEINTKHTVCYLNFNSGITTNKGISEFWRTVCVKVKSAMLGYVELSSSTQLKTEASAFEKLFKKDITTLRDIILIIDEASRLIDNETTQILDEFIASLRVLRDQREDISIVHSVVLIGTEVIKDFLIARAQQKNSTSIISPFSAEGVFNSARFTSLEVKELFIQYIEENKLEIDVDNIAADIYSLTLGHKGLVGACCHYFEEKIMSKGIKATIDDWEKHVPILLPQYIKDLATYKSIVQYLKNLNENQREILGEVLRYGDKEVSMDEYDVKFLLAEGMVVVTSQNKDGMSRIGCAAPILRTIMLSSIRGPNILSSPLPANTDHINPKWLLAHTVENLSIHNIFHEKTFNANNEPSEYAFQAEFLGIFKQLISKAYPSLEYRVFPEVKERDEGGQRRQHLDILVRNKTLPVYGFELSVAASGTVFDNHLERSDYYSRIHECNEMYTIDICHSEKLANYFGKQKYGNVIPVHVIYNLEDGKAKLVYESGDKEEVSLTGSKWQMMWD